MGDYGDQGYYGGTRTSGGYGGGHKRKRESEAIDPLKQLLHTLIYVGDDAMPSLELDEESIYSVVRQARREARNDPEAVQGMLVDCAIELHTKMPLYALVLGLLNAEDSQLVGGVVQQLAAEVGQSLMAGPTFDPRHARLLLRLLASLVAPGVVHAAGVVDALKGVVDAALAVARAGPEGDDGRSWQPYCDALVYWALMALPWGGSELAEAAGEKITALMESVDAYMAARPRSQQPSLRPFFAAIKDDDSIAESDNGGASFLGVVVEAVKAMVDGNSWQLESIPRVHIPFEVALADSHPHALPPLAIPSLAPVAVPEGASPALVGALVLDAFPPRGGIRFLDPQHTQGERPLIERLVCEEYLLDTLDSFQADRVECAKRLAGALPIPFSYEPLLCELLFGQLLRIPRPAYKLVFYSALMVDLCKLMKLFPRAMSACVRESFARMNVLDVTLRNRLAEWLAYHLSNFEYMWPWAKWAHVVAAPAYDGQRRFCVAVMNRLVRLSYWDRVYQVLPEDFRQLLPPKPEVEALPPADTPEEEDPGGVWAAKILQEVRGKAPPEGLDKWISDNELDSTLGGPLGTLRCLARALLVAGAKSYTHMVIALERYYGPLAARVQTLGLEAEVSLVDVACSVWKKSPQRAAMAVDRLMTLRLASAEAIVAWVFGSPGVLRLGDESSSAMSWEVLYNAINKTIARVQDARDDLAAAQQAAGNDAQGAQEALEKALEYVEETRGQEQAAFLQVLRGFVSLLSKGGSGEADGDGDGEGSSAMETEERGAWRDYTHACLKSFVRRYNVQVAQISGEIEQQILAEQGIQQEIKDAILSQLYL